MRKPAGTAELGEVGILFRVSRVYSISSLFKSFYLVFEEVELATMFAWATYTICCDGARTEV